MYKSPIEIIYGQVQTQIEGDTYRAVQSYVINVDKDELIRALAYDRGQYEKGYQDGQPKWIPVTERLPEEKQIVLAYCKYGTDWYGTTIFGYGENSFHDWDDLGFEMPIDVTVTHWMPLPEPPKEVE